jgi:hypothetical protein
MITKKIKFVVLVHLICLILYACTTPEVGTPKLPELISNFKVKITSNAYLVLDELNKALAPEDSLEFIAEENNLRAH